MRLLQVVPEDLLVFLDTRARPRLQPAGEPLVQVGPELFGDRLVRGVADEDVPEPVEVGGGLDAALGPQQLLADEGSQRWHRRPRRRRCRRLQGLDGVDRERAADHGGELDRLAFRRLQPIQAGGQERGDRGRQRHVRQIGGGEPRPSFTDQEAVVDQHRHDLLDEERVPARRLDDAFLRVRGDVGAAEEVRHERLAVAVGERFQQDGRGVHLPAAPRRPRLEQIGAAERDHHDRDVLRPVRDVIDQVEQRRLGPMHVVEHDHERPAPRQRLQERPDRPERLVHAGRALADPDHLRHAFGGLLAAAFAGNDPRDLAPRLGRRVAVGQAGRLGDDLDDRPERDPLAVRQAPPPERDRARTRGGEELLDQARLADARRSQDREQLALPAGDGPLERLPQQGGFSLAVDQRGVQAPGVAGRARDHLEQPVSADLPEPLERHRTHGLRRHGVPDQVQRRFAQEDLADPCRLFQPRGEVHRPARHERLSTAGVGRHDLAGVHPHPGLQSDTPRDLELLVERTQRIPHLGRRAHGADRVVLVEVRDAEDGDDRVADELLDRASVPLDGTAHLVVVPGDDLAERFGVQRLAELGGAGQVAEDDGHELAGLRRRVDVQPRSARVAEPSVVGIVGVTARA